MVVLDNKIIYLPAGIKSDFENKVIVLLNGT